MLWYWRAVRYIARRRPRLRIADIRERMRGRLRDHQGRRRSFRGLLGIVKRRRRRTFMQLPEIASRRRPPGDEAGLMSAWNPLTVGGLEIDAPPGERDWTAEILFLHNSDAAGVGRVVERTLTARFSANAADVPEFERRYHAALREQIEKVLDARDARRARRRSKHERGKRGEPALKPRRKSAGVAFLSSLRPA